MKNVHVFLELVYNATELATALLFASNLCYIGVCARLPFFSRRKVSRK
jgi:hypothetical protein